MLGKEMADLGNSTILIVGQHVYQDRYPTGPVALIGDLFIDFAGQFTSAFLNGALDRIGRHIRRLGCRYCSAKTRVRVGVPTTHACGGGQLADELGKDLATTRIDGCLLMLNGGPFRMSRHTPLLSSIRKPYQGALPPHLRATSIPC
jgi:hypothetical protein